MTNKTFDRITITGGALLVMVCLLWGGNMVSIKISNRGIPPLMAATVRSVIAAVLVMTYSRLKGKNVLLRGSDIKHGVIIGVLFGLDFLFLYWGTLFTNASRAIMFLYTHPFWVALGAHFLLPDDRLNSGKIAGLILAFGGLLSVFGSRSAELGHLYWVGDLMLVAAAIFWAATTLYIKKTMAGRQISHYQTLFAQLVYSIPVLGLGWFVVEGGQGVTLSMTVALAFIYQSIVIAFFSYVLWFWMIHTFPVSRLAAFTFLTPIFGVILGGIVLGDPLPVALWIGLGCIAAGIYMVNK